MCICERLCVSLYFYVCLMKLVKFVNWFMCVCVFEGLYVQYIALMKHVKFVYMCVCVCVCVCVCKHVFLVLLKLFNRKLF